MEDLNRRTSISSVSSSSTTATTSQQNYLNPNLTGNSLVFSRMNQSRHFANGNTNNTNNQFANSNVSLMNNVTPWIEQQQQQHTKNNKTNTTTSSTKIDSNDDRDTHHPSVNLSTFGMSTLDSPPNSAPLSLIHHANLTNNQKSSQKSSGGTNTSSNNTTTTTTPSKDSNNQTSEDDKSDRDADNEGNDGDIDDDDDDDELIPTAIVIKNIPFAIKKEQLLDAMTKLNLPLPYAFNYHFDNGVFRGLAFANFNSSDETSMVVNILNGREIGGRKLRVEYKKMLPQFERERIEREKREKRGQLEEQHRTASTASLASLYSVSSVQNSKFNPLNPLNSNNLMNSNGNNGSLNMTLSNSSYLHPESFNGTNNLLTPNTIPSNNNNNNNVTNNSTSSAPGTALLSDRLYLTVAPNGSNSNPPPMSLDFNDSETLDIYTKLILFKEESPIPLSNGITTFLHSELAFAMNSLTLPQRRIISVISNWLGLNESFENGLILLKRSPSQHDSLHRSLSSASMINNFSSPSSTPLQPMSSHFTGGSSISQSNNNQSNNLNSSSNPTQPLQQQLSGQNSQVFPKLMRSHSHGLINNTTPSSMGISSRYRQQSPRTISQSQSTTNNNPTSASAAVAATATAATSSTATPSNTVGNTTNTNTTTTTTNNNTSTGSNFNNSFNLSSNTIPLTTSTLQQLQNQQSQQNANQQQQQPPQSPSLHHSSSNVSLLRAARSQPFQQSVNSTPTNNMFLNMNHNGSSSNISTSAAAFTSNTPQNYSPFFGSFNQLGNNSTSNIGSNNPSLLQQQQGPQLTGGSMNSNATTTTIGGNLNVSGGSNFFGSNLGANTNNNRIGGLNFGKTDDLIVGVDNLSFER